MTSVLPAPQSFAAADGDPYRNLVKNGGFLNSPVFAESEYSYYTAVARLQNAYLSDWDYGSNGKNNGNDGEPRGYYIDVRSHGYAFDGNEWLDRSNGSNSVDLIGHGDNRHGFVGQHITGLIPGAAYDVSFLAGAAFAQDYPHAARMEYRVTNGPSRFGTEELDKELIGMRPTDPEVIRGSWIRYWEQHQRSFTARSADAYIRFADDTQNGFWSGVQLADVSVRLHTSGFSVSPGGDPVPLTRAGETRYPGVHLQATEGGVIPRQTVHVTLPPAMGLRFVPESGSLCQLTVQDAFGNATRYAETLPRDGDTATFEGVDLALSGKGANSVAWVAVKALPHGPGGETSLTFSVGDRTSPSTTVRVQAA
ncbi:hypothetical protein [Streptomyces sp. UNOC14_S4]|uniref:hypothetical protein n=1 Tax=Streptomyces sp. UNOC14_S4 TaxID=2872340 RepID=UPI001E4CA54D|nr:hypothetical protein [Streptomyces sp. UNOC14_S4]MCC3772372.1 hypothetical protein [Streptomyces sp. UNOC14_S4]